MQSQVFHLRPSKFCVLWALPMKLLLRSLKWLSDLLLPDLCRLITKPRHRLKLKLEELKRSISLAWSH